MEELNESIVDVPLSCGGSELPQHLLCLAKHRTGNSAGQIGCLSPANSYWQKETNSHFYSHPQAILSFFHLTCVSLDCGRKTTGAPENTFRQTENTQTPKRRQIVTRIFMKCVILSRFITLFLHQNNFLELIWLVDCFFFFLSLSLSLSKKNYVMGSLLRLQVAVMNLCTATYGSYFSTMQLLPHAKVVQ